MKDMQKARRKLEELAIPFTEESYLNYVRLGKVRVIKLFLVAGMPVDTRDNISWTALIAAAWNGKKSVVELLISAGADVNAVSEEGFTALLAALSQGYLEVAEMLITAGSSLQAKLESNWTALLFAVERNFFDLAKRLIAIGLDVNQRGGGFGRSYNPLELAAINGNIEMLKLLLESGAKINDESCCIVASAVQSKNLEIVKFVLENGGDVNAVQGHNQYSPLTFAIKNFRMMKLLLEAGADIFQENIHHRNAYQEAVWWRVKNKKVLKLLEPAKPELNDLVYHQGLYWGKHEPICENCLVWLEIGSVTKEYDIESWKCQVDGTTYILKEGVFYRETPSN